MYVRIKPNIVYNQLNNINILLLFTAQGHNRLCEKDGILKFFLQPKNHLYLHHTCELPELHIQNNKEYKYM